MASTPRPARPAAPAPPVAEPAGTRLPVALLLVGYLIFALAGVLMGALEVTLVPLRWGSTLVPIAPVLAALSGVLLPAVSRGLTDTMGSAVPPVLGQVVTIWALGTWHTGGDVLLPAGDTTWVSYTVLLFGALVPLVMVGVAARPGPWTWAGARAALRVTDRRARPGSGSGDAR
jgi:hypothetical protein